MGNGTEANYCIEHLQRSEHENYVTIENEKPQMENKDNDASRRKKRADTQANKLVRGIFFRFHSMAVVVWFVLSVAAVVMCRSVRKHRPLIAVSFSRWSLAEITTRSVCTVSHTMTFDFRFRMLNDAVQEHIFRHLFVDKKKRILRTRSVFKAKICKRAQTF